MCQIFSCIVTRTGKVYSQKDDPSHTQIALENNLPEDGKSELLRAKVEVRPREFRAHAKEPSIDAWEIDVDEPSRPEWYGDRHDRNALAAARKWWKARVVPPDASVEVLSGTWFVPDGSPQITQGGGVVWVFGTASPQIELNFGKVVTLHSSAPQITQNGGAVWAYDTSAPRIRMRDGKVVTSGFGAPQIAQSGGDVCTYDTSAPQIEQAGGTVWAYGTGAPQIAQSGGRAVMFGLHAPEITRVTGSAA